MEKVKVVVPTKLQLNGLVVTIKYTDNLPESDYGQYDPHTKLLSINKIHPSKEAIFETIFHELLHAILDHCGISKLAVDISENFEEMVVTAFENFLQNAISLEKSAWLKTTTVSFTIRKRDDC